MHETIEPSNGIVMLLTKIATCMGLGV